MHTLTTLVERSYYRWIIVAGLWLAHTINYLNFSTLGVLAPFFKEDLHLTSAQIGFFVSAVSIGSCIAVLPIGLAADMMGVRIILSLSILGMGVIWAFLSSISSYGWAIALLVLFGLTFGGVPPMASKSIAAWFPPIGRATAMGLKQTGVNFGSILAGALLPFLALNYSWRTGFLIVGIVEVACAGLVFGMIQDPPGGSREAQGGFNWKEVLALGASRNTMILAPVSFCFFACQWCFTAYLTLYCTRDLHHSAVQAGFYFAMAYLVGAFARILWSLASDYFLKGRRMGVLLLIAWMELISLLVLSLASFLPFLSKVLLVSILLFGASGLGFNALFLTIVAETTRKESIALSTSIAIFFGSMGGLVCPPFFGYLIDLTGMFFYSWMFLTLLTTAIPVLLYVLGPLSRGKAL
jgi:sugar phosphate permease